MRTLITGGSGSIGQVLVQKLLAKDDGSTIAIFSRDEQKQEAMAERFQSPRLRFFLGDIRDKDRVEFAIRDVDRVIHAAALKIVPALEYNPFEAVKTNIIGTQNIIDAVMKGGYRQVIALSTDKACSPTNLYGATKLCLEKIVIAANNVDNINQYSVVRYGNVAMSRGSVLPKFVELGQRLPVTDLRMTRFWITLDEASGFVLACLESMQGGEIFIPKMKSFRIQDVATMIGGGFHVVGARPGEKIHETIISEDECHMASEKKHRYQLNYPGLENCENYKYYGGESVKGAVTSANFVMNLDELREKLESVGIKCRQECKPAPSKSLKISKKR